MERTEPALVPEWLRCAGNITGGGASVHHHSDVSSALHSTRSRSFRGSSEKDSPRFLDRSSSSNSRRSSSSNGASKHPYSSFSRNHRDKNREREKEKSLPDDIWDHNSSDPLASILSSRVDRNALRRSQSLVSRKPGEPFSRISGNGVNQRAVFDKDFPSLGAEEKQGVTGIRRVLSPGLTSAVQSLPIGSSSFLGGEKWTSALAEVPANLTSNGLGQSSSIQQSVVTSSNSSSTAGLNMAEALSQPAARVRTTPQQPDKSQRLEELAIKQSRQLIPMTPSMPKPLVPSSADKSKQPKIAARTNELKSVSSANQSRAAQIRPDSANTSHVGKFLVLKPGRETVTTVGKDASNPNGDSNGKLPNGHHVITAPTTPTQRNSMVSAIENKAAALSLASKSSTVDKKSSQQSRSEFFNLMRRKTSSSANTIMHSDSSLAVSSPSAENLKEGNGTDNGNQMMWNGDRYDISEKIQSFSNVGDNGLSGNGSIYMDEEEVAFLRSLGWEENGGEDEGLTEEEINAFYQYMNRRPSMGVCQSSQPKCSTPSKSPSTISGVDCSDSSSSDSESEA